MAIDYEAYYQGNRRELESLLGQFSSQYDCRKLFGIILVSETKPLAQDILQDMGYHDIFPTNVFFNVNKDFVSEATTALKAFRDTFLTPEKSLFLLNGEGKKKRDR